MRLQKLSLAYPLLLIQLPVSYAGLCIPKSSLSSDAEYTATQTSEFDSITTTLRAETSVETSTIASESAISNAEPLSSSLSTTESIIELSTSFPTSPESSVFETQPPSTQLAITETSSTESQVDTPTTTTSEVQTPTSCTASLETEWDKVVFYNTSNLFYYGSYVVPSSGSAVSYNIGMKWQGGVDVTYKIDSATGRLALTNGDGDTYWLGVYPASSVGYYQMAFWSAEQIDMQGLSYVDCVRCSSGPLQCTTDGTNKKVYFLASTNDENFYTTEQLGIQGSGMSYTGCYANGSPLN